MPKEGAGFIDFFQTIPDHRLNRKKLHLVEEIFLVTFCAVSAGCDGWDDIELFGKTKLAYLRTFLPFKNGAPSDDTLRRFFRVLDPEKFESCFVAWVKSFQIDLSEKVVAFDGKTSRRSFDEAERAMHLISAFASEMGLVLGQLKVDGKSNEITAIPILLDLLDLKGAIITIDAMGAQSKIVEKIIEKEANYVIGLKGNQGNLHNDVKTFFEKKPKNAVFSQSTECDKGHGRIETRVCTITDDIQWLRERHPQWAKLNSIIEIESIREIKSEISVEKRYYIGSIVADTSLAHRAVRQHWAVENNLHWVLDMSFGDDQSRIRKGNAPRNIALVKKTVLNLLQIVKKNMPRISLKRMRKLAGWDGDFLTTVLAAKF